MSLCFGYVSEGGELYPKIPVRIRYRENGRPIHTTALLDSGSSVSFIQDDLASIWGIKHTRKEPVKVDTIGPGVNCTEWDLWVEVEGLKREDGTLEEHHKLKIPFYIPIASKRKVGVILGREGFFEKFDILFKEKDLKIILEYTGE